VDQSAAERAGGLFRRKTAYYVTQFVSRRAQRAAGRQPTTIRQTGSASLTTGSSLDLTSKIVADA